MSERQNHPPFGNTSTDTTDFSDTRAFPAKNNISTPHRTNPTEALHNHHNINNHNSQSGFRTTPPLNPFEHQIPLFLDYKKRTDTYKGVWPSWAAVSADKCARAGLKFIGPDDKVQCQYCMGILYSWEDGDSPLEEHRRHFGRCPFIEQKAYNLLEAAIKENQEKVQIPQNSERNQATTTNGFNVNNLQQQTESTATKRTASPRQPQVNGHRGMPSETGQQQPYMNQPLTTEQNNGSSTVELPRTEGETEVTSKTSRSQSERLDNAMKIVSEMGYEEELVRKAVEVLRVDNTETDIDTGMLLDTIYLIEDDF